MSDREYFREGRLAVVAFMLIGVMAMAAGFVLFSLGPAIGWW